MNPQALTNSKQSFNEKFSSEISSINKLENQNKNGFKIKKEYRNEDGLHPTGILKSSIQDLITPVVQISYNQIKNAKSKDEHLKLNSQRTVSSKQNHKIELMKTVSSLNRALSRKSKSGARSELKSECPNKGSFLSLNPSTSFHHQIHLDDENEWELDERIADIPVCASVNVSRIENYFPSKRSVSEVSKSIAHAISVSKKPQGIMMKNKEKHKIRNPLFPTLNEVKTVSLHELSWSTKSGGQSSARPGLKNSMNKILLNSKGKFGF